MNEIKSGRTRLLRAIEFALEEFAAVAKQKEDKKQLQLLHLIYFKIKKNFKKHYLICEPTNKSQISFAKIEAHKLDLKHRVKTTLRRYIRRELDFSLDKLLDKTLDLFGNLVNFFLEAEENIDDKITILNGAAVVEYYKKSNKISHSCMTGQSAKYTQLYAVNPDKVSLVVINKKTRALLWVDDNGVKILDRVYPSGHYTTVWLRQWAKTKGYIFRVKNTEIDYTAKKIDTSDKKEHKITLVKTSRMPYLDTFRFMTKIADNKIVLSNYEKDAEYLIANQLDILKLYQCSSCKEKAVDIDEFNKQYYCNDCYNNITTRCSFCCRIKKKIDFVNIKLISGYFCNNSCFDKYKTRCSVEVQERLQQEYNESHE